MSLIRRVPPQTVLMATFGATSVLNYAFSLVAGRLLAPADFGLLAFGQTVLLLCGVILETGVPWTLARDVATADADRVPALVRGALVTNLTISLVAGAVIAGLFVLGPLRPGLESGPVLIAIIVALPGIAMLNVARGAAQGLGRFVMLSLVLVSEVLVKVLLGLGLIVAGTGAAGGLAGFTAGSVVAALAGLAFLTFGLRVLLFGGVRLPALATAAPMFGALIGLALLINLDLMAVKLLVADRAAAGYYQAALLLANVPYFFVASALVPVLFNKIAAHGIRGEALGETLRLVALIAIPIEVALALAPEQVLGMLLPGEYQVAAGVLRTLSIGKTLALLVAILGATLQAAGKAHVAARVLGAVVAVDVILLWLTVPTTGPMGAAVVFSGSAFVAVIALGVIVGRSLTLDDRRTGPSWVARYAAVLAASSAAWIGAGGAGLVASAIAAASVFGGGVLMTGLWSLPLPFSHPTQPAGSAGK